MIQITVKIGPIKPSLTRQELNVLESLQKANQIFLL